MTTPALAERPAPRVRPPDVPALANPQSVPLSKVPVVGMDEFRAILSRYVHNGSQLSALFGVPTDSATVRLYGVVTKTAAATIHVLAADVIDRYPALTSSLPQAHWFEREIAEQWGVVPEGHPWLKPIRFHPSYRAGHDAWGRDRDTRILPCVTDYFRMAGHEAHEVAVGPVHAGVIEPGHFRFQCHGEQVFHLEISLGYQHRGIERRLAGGPNQRTLHYMETLAGDTTIGHAIAYCQAVESLSDSETPLRAQALRAIALELERLANHTGDLGALAADVGFLPTHAYCGRLRGDFLNATALLCGNRFGRSMIRPGGVGWDIDSEQISEISKRIESSLDGVAGAVRLLWTSPSVLARFEETGRVTRNVAQETGSIGSRRCPFRRGTRATCSRVPICDGSRSSGRRGSSWSSCDGFRPGRRGETFNDFGPRRW
jgi:hypothetical protein